MHRPATQHLNLEASICRTRWEGGSLEPSAWCPTNNPDYSARKRFGTLTPRPQTHAVREVMVPKGSNSGTYVMGEYEIQVLDSAGRDSNPGPGGMGAIYGAQPPGHPVYRQPGEWNQYEIHWLAPRFDAAGRKTANAKSLKVILNGAVIHEGVEMPGPTPGGVDGKEKARGPLMFQGNHGPVSYRNLRLAPLPVAAP